MLENLLYFY